MNTSHSGSPAETLPPLALTAAAEEAIRVKLNGVEGSEPFAFFVITQPSRLGYNVGVGFEREGGARALRREYPVPLQIDDDDLDRLRGTIIDFRDEQFVTSTNISVHVAETPNPDSRKFILNRDLVTGGSATFAHGGAAMTPPVPGEGEVGEVERRIIEVLEDVVRPAVQRDGGDIAFAGFDNGVVQLYMLGSCVGCPSSVATLKMGVEALFKDAVPEVTEVVAIS